MRNVKPISLAVHVALLLMLIIGSSTGVGHANTPEPPLSPVPSIASLGALDPCAHCYRNGTSGWGWWEGECYDYESPSCRSCPTTDDCSYDTWFSQTDLCNLACNASRLAVADKFESAIVNDDPATIRALLNENVSLVSFNKTP